MFKRIISLFIIMILLSTSFVFGLEEVQEVTVYNKGINLNGEKIINAHSLYPYFVYKDVIYLPLTKENSKIVGYKMTWNEDENKMSIANQAPTQRNYNEQWIKQEWKKIKAQPSDIKLFVDDKEYQSEDYPIMTFDYIAYVPLTTQVLSEYLKWDMFYNQYSGICISTDENVSADSIFDKEAFKYYEALANYARTINKNLSQEEAMNIVMLIIEKSEMYQMDELLIFSTVWQESNFNPQTYYKGAIGLMQIMKSTGANAGLSAEMLYDPETNVDFGVKYLKEKMNRYNQQEVLAISAYNQGSGSVDRGNYSTGYYNKLMKKKKKVEAYLQEKGITKPKM